MLAALIGDVDVLVAERPIVDHLLDRTVAAGEAAVPLAGPPVAASASAVPLAGPPVLPAAPESDAPPASTAPKVSRRARVGTPALVGGALLLIAAGGWITWMMRTRSPETSVTAPPPDTRAAAPPASPSPAAPANQPAAAASELTTTRRVWVRVIADGQRIVEGELPANARVPLTAEKTVVIRAGNAGVVRLTLRGKDQGALGPEGTVVTRSFVVPPRAQR